MEDNQNHHHNEHEHKESNQELTFKASLIERHIQDLSEKMEYVSQQLSELEEFSGNMKFIKNSKGKNLFAPLGRGIYVKSSSQDDDLFVNVGAGVIVKKTPEETSKIIENQIKSFHEAKTSLMEQLEIYKNLMNQTLVQLENPGKE
jgi:prefoldin alpha subunit